MLSTEEETNNLAEANEWKEKGNLLFKSANYREAIELYSKSIQLSPITPTFYSNRAAAYLNNSQFKLALQDCLSALKLDPEMIKALFRAIKCQIHLGNLEDAKCQIQNLNSIIDSSKDQKSQNKALSARELVLVKLLEQKIFNFQSMMESKSFYNALSEIEAAMILIDPTLEGSGLPNSISKIDTNMTKKIPTKWCIFRAEALFGLWDSNEAGQIARSILRSDSKNSEAIYIVAKSMYYLESHPIATINQYLSTALSFDPDNKSARTLFKMAKKLEAIKQQGNEAYKSADWNSALEAYNEFCSQDPYGAITRAKVLSNRAIIYSKLNNLKEVLQDSNECIEILDKINFPNDYFKQEHVSNEDRAGTPNQALYIKVYLRLADAHTKLEEFEEAVRDYEAASAIDPSNREVKSALQQAKHALKLSKRKNYYKILGVDKSASSSEIKKAYRKSALLYHPDKQASLGEDERAAAEIKFKEIGEAYSVLSDERKKQMFDNGQDIDGSSASAGHDSNPFGGGVRMEDLFAQFGGGGGFGHGGGFGGGFGGGHGFHSHYD